MRGYSELYLALDGYVVLDNMTMPILSTDGNVRDANDTYVEQLVADARAGVAAAANAGFIDPNRVGVAGHSYGAFMVANLLAHSDLFKAGFDMAGVHYAGDAEGERYSAIGNIDTWTSPVFLAQGDDDMNVNFNQGTTLARTLQVKRPNVELRQQVLPGQTHDLYLTYEQLVGIYDEGSNWLLAHMGVK